MSDALDWDRDGAAWPRRALSRFVEAGGLRWRVEIGGSGPAALLLHGTGASTHSFAGLAPLLEDRFEVIAPDLPGHGFTGAPNRSALLSLPNMAAAVGALTAALDRRPTLVLGHSAGAAIALRAALSGRLAPRLIVGVNAALKPFPGSAGWLFPAMAKTLFLNPLTPRLFAASARDPRRAERLIGGTGSTVSAEALALYARLFRAPEHVAGALGMMANWDLTPLLDALPALEPHALFLTGANDRFVPPSVSLDAARRAPSAEVVTLADVGHLPHEERPERVADLVLAAAETRGAL